MTDRSAHCCLCGVPRRPTHKPAESFGNDGRILIMNEHRPMLPGRWQESPQMIAQVMLYRNGGTAPGQTHICDDCFLVGLHHVKRFVDQSIAALSPESHQ
jgi:hypothetical protein